MLPKNNFSKGVRKIKTSMVRNKLKEAAPKAVETTEQDKKAKKFGRK